MTNTKMTNSQLNEKFGYTTVGQQEAVGVYNPTIVPNDDKNSKSRITSLTAECCYSISNLALIIACVVAMIVLVKFTFDGRDPLYEYGEHLLTRRFYDQLIYIIVVVALVLLVPLYNAASAIFFPTNKKSDTSEAISILKIVYQVLMLILVFVALIIVSPYIGATNLSNQIELELMKHIKFRYDQPVSYKMLNSLQEEYECCDETWYRATLGDQLPTSCFVPTSNYNLIFDETCADALGTVVSTRCIVIAVSLIIILVALVYLIINDFNERSARSNRQYQVNIRANGSHPAIGKINETPTTNRRDSEDLDCTASNRNEQTPNGTGQQTRLIQEDRPKHSYLSNTASRLNLGDRKQEEPLLLSRNLSDPSEAIATATKSPTLATYVDDDDQLDEDLFREQLINVQQSKSPTILARANYHVVQRDRSQSPVFLAKNRSHEDEAEEKSNKSTSTSPSPSVTTKPVIIKSALKKTSSTQRIEYESNLQEAANSSSAEDADSLSEYAEKLRTNSLIRHHQQEQQTKRSLLNVRFAD